jgi:hypothetical protein
MTTGWWKVRSQVKRSVSTPGARRSLTARASDGSPAARSWRAYQSAWKLVRIGCGRDPARHAAYGVAKLAGK